MTNVAPRFVLLRAYRVFHQANEVNEEKFFEKKRRVMR